MGDRAPAWRSLSCLRVAILQPFAAGVRVAEYPGRGLDTSGGPVYHRVVTGPTPGPEVCS